jgi:DNA ligase (NAD+)
MIDNREDYLKAVERAQQAARSYYVTDSLVMSDDEYDALTEEIETAGERYGWTEGAALLEEVAAGQGGGGDVEHAVPMLSLGKVKTEQAVLSFEQAYPNETLVFEPKLDGSAISAVYRGGKLTQVSTRGDGNTGEDLTQNIINAKPQGLPLTVQDAGDFEVRGEIYITRADFEHAQTLREAAGSAPFKNPRNAIAGATRTSKPLAGLRMSFSAYEALGFSEDSYTKRLNYLSQLGFGTALALVPANVKAQEGLAAQIEEFGRMRDEEGYVTVLGQDIPTDGAVVKFDSYAHREQVGAASRHPRWAVAYKYSEELKQTVLRSIERAVGRTGAISYVGHFDPTEFDSTISQATFNNSDWIEERDLHIGDTILVRKANGVIPEVRGVNLALRPKDAVKYVAPLTCPNCGEPLNTSSKIWRCTNPEDALGAWLAYAVSREHLDVDGLSTAIIDRLVEQNLVNDLADLFYLPYSTWESLDMGRLKKDGTPVLLGTTMATKITGEIEKAKQQPLNRVLSALGIRFLGRTFGRRLAAQFGSLDALLTATEADFDTVSGVNGGGIRAAAFVKGFAARRNTLLRMKNAGFQSLQAQAPQPAVAKVDTSSNPAAALVAGKNVVVTGTVPGYSRTEAAELIESLGGHASSSVSSKTQLVIAGEGAGSKAEKARSLGVQVLDAAEFVKLVR